MRPAFLAPLVLVLALGAAPAARATSVAPPPAADGAIAAYRFPSGEAPARRTTLDLGGVGVAVWLPAAIEDVHAARQLELLRTYLGELPAAHLAALHTVAFDPGEFPANARKAQQLGQPELKLWASARAGVIVFYRNTPPGDWRVTRRRVFHELGHCLAHLRFGTSTPPPAWTEAARADDRFFSEYTRKAFEATGTLVEDFAEAYATYMQALVDGEEPLARFRADFPARARLLEIYAAPQ